MVEAGAIREHMEVLGSDGKHVGKVDHVIGDKIELAKFDFGAGLKHHYIPVSWADYVDSDGKIHLTLSEDEAKSRWMDKRH